MHSLKVVKNSTQLLSTQKAFAANASYMLQPGDPFPDEDGHTTMPVATPIRSLHSTITGSGLSSTASDSADGELNTLNQASFPPAAIAGIVVGVVVILALSAALCFLIGRKRMSKAQETIFSPAGSVNTPTFSTYGQNVASPSENACVPAPINTSMSPPDAMFAVNLPYVLNRIPYNAHGLLHPVSI